MVQGGLKQGEVKNGSNRLPSGKRPSARLSHISQYIFQCPFGKHNVKDYILPL